LCGFVLAMVFIESSIKKIIKPGLYLLQPRPVVMYDIIFSIF